MSSVKMEAEDRWRLEWAFHNPWSWTRRLIGDPLMFYRKRRSINHYVLQILTGHGIFNCYRHRIDKKTHSSCWDYGDPPQDDAEHVLIRCPRWVAERSALETELGVEFRLENGIVERIAA
jgi:hypothetical protein